MNKMLLFALAAWASLPLPAAAPPARMVRLADRVYCLESGDGNVGLVVGRRGAVLVDGQAYRDLPGLLEAIRAVTRQPIRYLVNTHEGPGQADANAGLAPHVGTTLAHFNAWARMRKAHAEAGLPDVAVGVSDPAQKALVALDLGDTEVHLFHLSAGHTDGDLVLGLPDLHVMHMGNLFWNGLTPVIDVERGGSLAGILATVEGILSWLPEDNRVIPGHGPVGTKRDLARYRDFLRAVQAHVQANPGKSGQELDLTFDHAAWRDYRDLGPRQTWTQFFDLAAGRSGKTP